MESRKDLFEQIFINPIDEHDNLLNQGSYMKTFEDHLYNSVLFSNLTYEEIIILINKINTSQSTKHNKEIIRLIVRKALTSTKIIQILKYYRNNDYKCFIKLLANVVEICSVYKYKSSRTFFNTKKRDNDFRIITLRLIGKYISELSEYFYTDFGTIFSNIIKLIEDKETIVNYYELKGLCFKIIKTGKTKLNNKEFKCFKKIFNFKDKNDVNLKDFVFIGTGQVLEFNDSNYWANTHLEFNNDELKRFVEIDSQYYFDPVMTPFVCYKYKYKLINFDEFRKEFDSLDEKTKFDFVNANYLFIKYFKENALLSYDFLNENKHFLRLPQSFLDQIKNDFAYISLCDLNTNS